MSDIADFGNWLASYSPGELAWAADERETEIWYHCIDLGVPMARCLMWPDREPCCGMVSEVTGQWLGLCLPPRRRVPDKEERQMHERAWHEKEYSGYLRHWEGTGFIKPGWSVRWDEGAGAHVISFETLKDKTYELSESEFDYYMAGVVDSADFYTQEPPEPSLAAMRFPIERLNPQTGEPWSEEELQRMREHRGPENG